MHTSTLTLLFCISLSIQAQQKKPLQFYYREALEAHQAGDYKIFYDRIVEASNLHPYHQGIMYQRGIAAALTDKPEEAIRYLRDAILINSSFDLRSADLKSISNKHEFLELLKTQREITTSIIQSDTAFTIKDRALHIESIAAGEKKDVFYLSSVHKRKVIRINNNNRVEDFTMEGQDGATSILGLKIDSHKKYLWICSSPMPEMINFDSTSRSTVLKYDLKTKRLLKKFVMEKESVFGDLILNKKGEALISDSRNNIIYKANESNGNLEVYFSSPEFWNIQGITFSEDEKLLFISDYIKGIYQLNTETKELTKLEKEPSVSLKSVDGLIWYKNSLIAFQNGITPMRATRYFLNKSLTMITHYEIIDRDHPAFNEPTNGCVAGQILYYVANSQWGGYDEHHHPKPAEQLQDIVILKYSLPK